MSEKRYISTDSNSVKLMPHSIDAEASVLGAILIDNLNYDKVIKHIPEEKVFYLEKHQIVFKAIKSLIKDQISADIITVLARLNEKEKEIVSSYWLSGIVTEITTTGNIEIHAKLVYEKHLHRQIIRQTYKIQKIAYNDTFGFMELIEKVRDLNEEVMDTKPVAEFDLKSLTKLAIESIGESKNLVSFGYNALDSMAGGMTRGEITVLAGRPGHGKTTFSINLAKKLLDQNLKVLVMNREMTNEEMLKKLLVLNSGKVSYHSIRTGDLTDISAKEIDESQKEIVKKYSKNLIMYDDVSSLNETISIISRIRPDIVIDDYIQLVKVSDKKDRRFEIESVMQEYKWLAKKYKIIPILLSQLNRDIERRIDPIPKMSDLAEGSSIEQVAENILFIYYDYKVNYQNSSLGRMKSQIIAAKVRYGNSGMFTIGVDHDKVCYHENIPELQNKIKEVHVRSHDELVRVVSKFQPKQESVSFK
tara:strand:- start:648 stop:2072 length:1425 start_codon:yes stop_codon:yes gene_type:complete